MRLVAVVGAVALLTVVPAYVDREDAPTPSAERIERSVNEYSIAGSVEQLVEETTEGRTMTVTVGADVLFAFNSAELDDRAQAALAELVDELPESASVLIEGHTDSRGSADLNLTLSQDRAQAVADLVARERPGLDLTVEGHGSSQLVATEYVGDRPDDDAMAKNRRVELTLRSD